MLGADKRKLGDAIPFGWKTIAGREEVMDEAILVIQNLNVSALRRFCSQLKEGEKKWQRE